MAEPVASQTRSGSVEQAKDARKFLELLLSDCEINGHPDHRWQKCRRCLAMSELENRQPLARKFIQQAIDFLAVQHSKEQS